MQISVWRRIWIFHGTVTGFLIFTHAYFLFPGNTPSNWGWAVRARNSDKQIHGKFSMKTGRKPYLLALQHKTEGKKRRTPGEGQGRPSLLRQKRKMTKGDRQM